MPLNWLGQLGPSMQQQIALQRALLALQREDEQIRMKTIPQAEQPALERRLVAGPGRAIAGGPSYKEQPPSPLATEAGVESYARPSAGGLEEALRTAAPVTGRPDWQAEAWARRKEIVGEHVVGAKEAYDRIITLDPNGQKVALNALRRYKREVYNAMEKEGYLSPAGVLVEPKKKVAFKTEYTSEGWIHERTMFEDGTTTDEVIAPAPEEAVEAPSITEIINAQKLGIDIEQHEERFYRDALKFAGDKPRIGIDMVIENGEERPTEQKDVDAWKTNMNNLIKFFRESAGVVSGAEVPTMEEVKAMYEGRPDLINDIQRQLGLTATGVWDETLEEAFKAFGGVE